MLLESVIKAAQFKIVGGAPFGWQNFGSNARTLEFSKTGDGYDCASVVFDTVTQEVYEITFNPEFDASKNYRWINPTYLDEYKKECLKKGVTFEIFGDSDRWIDCELSEDIVDKISTYFSTGTFDERIMVSLDLSDEAVVALNTLAAAKGVSIDIVAEEILTEELSKRGA